MPIWTYFCLRCFNEYDKQQKRKRRVKCPRCSADALDQKRIITYTGRAIFKGTGFYETDYKGKK